MPVIEVMGIAAAIAIHIIPEFTKFLQFKVIIIICKFAVTQSIVFDFIELYQGLVLQLLQMC
jgi:hypothetical protein